MATMDSPQGAKMPSMLILLRPAVHQAEMTLDEDRVL